MKENWEFFCDFPLSLYISVKFFICFYLLNMKEWPLIICVENLEICELMNRLIGMSSAYKKDGSLTTPPFPFSNYTIICELQVYLMEMEFSHF